MKVVVAFTVLEVQSLTRLDGFRILEHLGGSQN